MFAYERLDPAYPYETTRVRWKLVDYAAVAPEIDAGVPDGSVPDAGLPDAAVSDASPPSPDASTVQDDASVARPDARPIQPDAAAAQPDARSTGDHSGGCGCHAAGGRSPSPAGLLLLAGLVLAIRRRRTC
jgi:MYXO-CTERM domain-containing protein